MSFTFGALAASAAEPFTARSGPKQVALVELFSSEGCSSCPRADRRLGALGKEAGLWRDFVPVEFHVDYWDNLGWRDKFATKENTERQVRYAELNRTENVYTPEFVLNGTEWRGWGRVSDIVKRPALDAGVLELQSAGTNRFRISYQPSAAQGRGDWDVTLAWLGSDIISNVARGENAGRQLPHEFVVLKSSVFRLKETDGAWAGNYVFELPADSGKVRLAVAGWISKRGSQVPLQAAGGWWNP